jgi:hypothetical protein
MQNSRIAKFKVLFYNYFRNFAYYRFVSNYLCKKENNE